MKVLVTHPYCWPYVRRGSERYTAELASYLSGRGHDVVTISSKPGRSEVEQTPTGKRVLHHQYWAPPMAKLRIQPTHTFLATSLASLSRHRADAVHSLYYTDALSASVVKTTRRFRTIYQVTGAPLPSHFPRMPPDRWLLERALARADRLMVHSEFARDVLKAHYGRDATVIPVPIDLNAFPFVPKSNNGTLTILSVACFDEARKGLSVLADAFAGVRKNVPEARLKLSGQLSRRTKERVLDPLPDDVRAGIEILGVGQLEELPELYREASVTVLASMWEAYGMSIVESWSCGTPVVVTNHGGPAELVDDPRIGRRFDPQTQGQVAKNPAGLADAILEGWALAQDPATADRCRARAARLSWDVLGPEIEKLYD